MIFRADVDRGLPGFIHLLLDMLLRVQAISRYHASLQEARAEEHEEKSDSSENSRGKAEYGHDGDAKPHDHPRGAS
jgi:hypothetical protein